MDIRQATIHQLSKATQTRGPGSVGVLYRENELPVDQPLRNVSAELLSMYNTRSNSTGTFGENPALHQFPVLLDQYVGSSLSFAEFTRQASALIEKELSQSLLASGGFALFLRYEQNASDYLMVAMLKLKPGAGINEKTLDLEATLNIDVNLLHEAARINLTRYASKEQPYLTFIRGKSKAGAVTEYFRTALACENFTHAKLHTELVIRAASDFVAAREDIATEDERQRELISMRERLYGCFAQNRKEVVLQTLAAAIMPQDPENFIDFVREAAASEQYHIPHQFQPDKKTFQRLRRIQGRIGKTISLSFSVEDVQESRVMYDQSRNVIVLKEPSGELIKAINENVLSA